MDLFDSGFAPKNEPLAHRLRPKKLSEWVGHEKVVGPSGLIQSWLRTKRFPSILLWGPPGVGKTSLAMLIAEQLGDAFIQLSAVNSGVKDIKDAAEQARNYLRLGRKTLLFFDEIHRLNKSQQDSLLPHVEKGLFTLVGATTENPSFEVNAALLSRVRVIRLERLTSRDLEFVLDRAIKHEDGLDNQVNFAMSARALLIDQAEGDARRLLTLLEAIVLLKPDQKEFSREETESLLLQLGDRVLPYDKNSEDHYNAISAFIKSMRASDPDAAVYYLARMIECGEDPLFIARRMIVFASEDIGNAEPRALLMAVAAKEALETVGMPEARINLAHAAITLALSKKDRAVYDAIEKALQEVRLTGALPIPMQLRNYQYGKEKSAERLPDGIKEKVFFRPRSTPDTR